MFMLSGLWVRGQGLGSHGLPMGSRRRLLHRSRLSDTLDPNATRSDLHGLGFVVGSVGMVQGGATHGSQERDRSVDLAGKQPSKARFGAFRRPRLASTRNRQGFRPHDGGMGDGLTNAGKETGEGGVGSKDLRPLVDLVSRHLRQRILRLAVSCLQVPQLESISPPQDHPFEAKSSVKGGAAQGQQRTREDVHERRRDGAQRVWESMGSMHLSLAHTLLKPKWTKSYFVVVVCKVIVKL